MADYRYHAFISYSHRDALAAEPVPERPLRVPARASRAEPSSPNPMPPHAA